MDFKILPQPDAIFELETHKLISIYKLLLSKMHLESPIYYRARKIRIEIQRKWKKLKATIPPKKKKKSRKLKSPISYYYGARTCQMMSSAGRFKAQDLRKIKTLSSSEKKKKLKRTKKREYNSQPQWKIEAFNREKRTKIPSERGRWRWRASFVRWGLYAPFYRDPFPMGPYTCGLDTRVPSYPTRWKAQLVLVVWGSVRARSWWQWPWRIPFHLVSTPWKFGKRLDIRNVTSPNLSRGKQLFWQICFLFFYYYYFFKSNSMALLNLAVKKIKNFD